MATATKQGKQGNATTATRNARMRGKAGTASATPRKAKASGAAKATKATKAKATTKATTVANPAPAQRRKPGTHGLVPVATGKLPKATCAALLAVPKAGKGNAGKGMAAKAPNAHLGLVYRSMRCQATGTPVATVHSAGKGKLPAGWLAVCLATGAYGLYASRHAAATAMAYPQYHAA